MLCGVEHVCALGEVLVVLGVSGPRVFWDGSVDDGVLRTAGGENGGGGGFGVLGAPVHVCAPGEALVVLVGDGPRTA